MFPSPSPAGLPRIAARVYGYTSARRGGDNKENDDEGERRYCLCVVTELCENGNLEDFMEQEGAPLSPAVKLDIMLQVAAGLEQLKEARVLWRDLKAKNLLVRDVQRGRMGEVVRVVVAFTDWGTAVKLPPEGKRRMTLHGPGTAGYIAPDTRGPAYDYQADMWAYLVWAASMCLRVEFIVDCQLEEALAELSLEKKIAPTAGHEDKVDVLLRGFEEDGKVEEGCEGIFELVRTSAPWVDATLRWTPEEAKEEMEVFRGDHGLVIDVAAVQQRRISMAPRRPAPPPREKEEEEEEMMMMMMNDRRGMTAAAPEPESAGPAAMEEEEEDEEEEEAVRAARGCTAPAPTPSEDDAVAETDDEVEEEEDEEEDKVADHLARTPSKSSPKIAAAAAAAANVSAQWVGRRVRKWFPLPVPHGRRPKNAPPLPAGEYFFGYIAHTHAVANLDTGEFETCCFVRYDDGDEEDLTLDECRRLLVEDDDEKHEEEEEKMEVDTDAETEMVGGLHHGGETPGEVQQRRGRGRATALSSGRMALGNLNSNELQKRNGKGGRRGDDGKEKRGKAAAAAGALAIVSETLPTTGKRGRVAPDWAREAVDVHGVKLGCSKCRRSRYGCATCRTKNGVTPSSSLALPAPGDNNNNIGRKRGRPAKSPAAEDNTAAPATASNKKPRNTAAAAPKAASAAAAAPAPASTPSTALALPLIHINDASTPEQLAAQLPPGVELGCSKCRFTWRGCTVCRTKAGVWLPLAANWHRRRSNQARAAAAAAADMSLLALPCPGDELRTSTRRSARA